MRAITEIIVHCSATPASLDIGAAEIDRMHRVPKPAGPGMRKIGYHEVIRRSGLVEFGRAEAEPGAHTIGTAPDGRSYNQSSIGICLIGGADSAGRGEANFMPAQMAALGRRLAWHLIRYPGARVLGHRDTGAQKDCPSFDIAHWLASGEMIRPRNLA